MKRRETKPQPIIWASESFQRGYRRDLRALDYPELQMERLIMLTVAKPYLDPLIVEEMRRRQPMTPVPDEPARIEPPPPPERPKLALVKRRRE